MVRIIKSLYNTLYFNFRVFSILDALKFRVLLGPNVRFNKLQKNSLLFKHPKFGCVRLGLGGGSFGYADRSSSYLNISGGATIIVEGTLYAGRGFVINFTGNHISKIGDKFSANYGVKLSISESFECGENLRLGWNVSIIDADGHTIRSTIDNTIKNTPKDIKIGKNVWLASESVILKGVNISDSVIVPYGAIITKSSHQNNIIWGGTPNRTLKENIYWDYESE